VTIRGKELPVAGAFNHVDAGRTQQFVAGELLRVLLYG